jgi:hypothetical protein
MAKIKTYADYTPQEIEAFIGDPVKMAELQRRYDAAVAQQQARMDALFKEGNDQSQASR